MTCRLRGSGDGADVIADFEDGVDRIDLGAFGIAAGGYDSVPMPLMGAVAGGMALDLTPLGGGTVTIPGLDPAGADRGDFVP